MLLPKWSWLVLLCGFLLQHLPFKVVSKVDIDGLFFITFAWASDYHMVTFFVVGSEARVYVTFAPAFELLDATLFVFYHILVH